MKFKIEIDCDNEAFQNGQLTDELHLILHRIIHDLPNDIDADATEFSRNLRDTNGNHVGFVELIEEKAKVEVKVETEVEAQAKTGVVVEEYEPNDFILCDLCQDSVHKDTTSYAYDLPARISYRVCKKCWHAILT